MTVREVQPFKVLEFGRRGETHDMRPTPVAADAPDAPEDEDTPAQVEADASGRPLPPAPKTSKGRASAT